MYAFLLMCFISIFACLDLAFCNALCPSWVCAWRSLGPLACVVAFTPSYGLLDVTTCETCLHDVGVLDTPLSPLCAMLLYLPCLLCATRLAFFASVHLCTLACMFMHESVRCSYSNHIELWTPDPNLHLSS